MWMKNEVLCCVNECLRVVLEYGQYIECDEYVNCNVDEVKSSKNEM